MHDALRELSSVGARDAARDSARLAGDDPESNVGRGERRGIRRRDHTLPQRECGCGAHGGERHDHDSGDDREREHRARALVGGEPSSNDHSLIGRRRAHSPSH